MFLDGKKIGLFGGSFDPPHLGHVHFSLQAIKLFNLDKVIWLISPGNPLKSIAPAPIHIRIEQAQKITHNPKVIISRVETEIGAKYSWETLDYLSVKYPRTKFVWLMGADNLVNFHLWRDWKKIFYNIPIAIFDRPFYSLSISKAKATLHFKEDKISSKLSRYLKFMKTPSWSFIRGLTHLQSSTKIRQKKVESP